MNLIQNEPSVGVVLLTYRAVDITIECLRSVLASDYGPYFVIMVENGSPPAIAEALEHAIAQESGEVEFLKLFPNVGFAGGNNAGIRLALQKGARYVLLLNNDTVVSPSMLTHLVKAAESDLCIGAAGAKNYYYDTHPEVWYCGLCFDWKTGRVEDIGKSREETGSRLVDVDYVPGSSILLRREALEKIGLLDEEYFCYAEESDWCLRAKEAGYRVVYMADATLRHRVGYTNPSAVRNYFEFRNNPRFALWHMPRQYRIRYFRRYLWRLFRLLIHHGRRGQWKPLWAGYLGAWDFLVGRFGRGRSEYFVR